MDAMDAMDAMEMMFMMFHDRNVASGDDVIISSSTSALPSRLYYGDGKKVSGLRSLYIT
jgi:hypothetical protein